MPNKPAFHENLTREETLEIGSDRSFCFVVGGILALIGCYHLWHGHASTPIWLALSAPLLLLGIVNPSLAHPLNRRWMQLGGFLARLTNPVFLALIYGLSILPMGLVMRAFGRDPMRRRLDAKTATYWQKRDDIPHSMTNQF